MGWWKIDSVERGQIDCSHKCPTNPQLVNAVPGREAEDAMYNGDGPADLMEPVLRKIDAQYVAAWGRPAKPDELRAVFNFCLNGMLRQRESRNANVTGQRTRHLVEGTLDPLVGRNYSLFLPSSKLSPIFFSLRTKYTPAKTGAKYNSAYPIDSSKYVM